MSEKIDSQMPGANPNISPSDLSESERILRSRATGRRWGRVVRNKAGPDVEGALEVVKPLRRMPAAFQWVRVSWMRRLARNRTKKEKVSVGTHETEDNMTAFMTMAKYAITLAVESEPEIGAQSIKRRALMSRWRHTYGRVFGQNSRS